MPDRMWSRSFRVALAISTFVTISHGMPLGLVLGAVSLLCLAWSGPTSSARRG